MEEDKNRPSGADPSEPDVSSEEGEENVSQESPNTSEESSEGEASEILGKIKNVTGKDFKSLDDFQKHYKNLKEFSGTEEAQETRKKAEMFDQLQKEADRVNKKMKANESPDDKLSSLEKRFNKSEFLRKNPEAEKHFTLVEALANQKGLDYQEAWDNHVKEYGESLQDKEQEKSDIIESKQRSAVGASKDISNLVNQIQKNRKIGKGTEEIETALVKKFLGQK
jgi:hypothetical protein